MSKHYSTDNECLLTGGLWALVIALILGGLSMFFFDLWPTVIVIFAVAFVLGFLIAVFMCKSRTVGRGGTDVRAVDIARAEMGMASPAQSEPEAEADVTPAPEPAPEPEPTPAPVHEDHSAEEGAGEAKPALLSEARGGQADDLKKIKGVGPKLEKELNAAGVFHFDQIASWTTEEIYWADNHLVSFKGRVSRDSWVEQAKELLK